MDKYGDYDGWPGTYWLEQLERIEQSQIDHEKIEIYKILDEPLIIETDNRSIDEIIKDSHEIEKRASYTESIMNKIQEDSKNVPQVLQN